MNILKLNSKYVGIYLLFFIIISFTGCRYDENYTDIALYSDRGADEGCIKASLNMFKWMGYSIRLIKANDINSGMLKNYKILCVPGGDMYIYSQDISSDGKEKIRDFISNGGGYIGICAGAYFTGKSVIWLGNQLPMEPLKIFPGTTRGPIDEIIPYPEYGMCKVNIINKMHYITQNETDTAHIMYIWGPIFSPDIDANVTILGNYSSIEKPAIVTFDYGNGKVFLTGCHPEFEEDSDRDSVKFKDEDELEDKGSDWDLMKKATKWCIK